MKEIRVKGNTVRLEDGEVFISDTEKSIAQNIKNVFIYYKASCENDKTEYFLTGSVGFIDSEYNIATFFSVEKLIVDKKNNSMEVYILF